MSHRRPRCSVCSLCVAVSETSRGCEQYRPVPEDVGTEVGRQGNWDEDSGPAAAVGKVRAAAAQSDHEHVPPCP